MKWKDFRSWMNEYFDAEDDIRITVNSDIEGIYQKNKIAHLHLGGGKNN